MGDERPAILVVDEQTAGVYDTVYVDMNFNFDFSDDKAARMGDEVIGADWWGEYDEATDDYASEPDGVYDASGGMVYWVSDGVNPPPAADWWWGVGEAGNGVQDDGEPDAGALVLFSYSTWATSPAGNHGQLVASNIAGQGHTNADSYEYLFGASQLDRDAGYTCRTTSRTARWAWSPALASTCNSSTRATSTPSERPRLHLRRSGRPWYPRHRRRCAVDQQLVGLLGN